MSEKKKLPPYMKILFNKVYQNASLSGFLDDNRIVRLLNFGAKDKVLKEMLKDVSKNAHVLQIGLTFGDEIDRLYHKVFKQGKLEIFDISEVQINRVKEKYPQHNIVITEKNAALVWNKKFDVIICYNLLREVPLQTRQKIMDNALNNLSTGGKAIFIDYSEPDWWNPIKWPMLLFNRLYRPFAESLWHTPIENFCKSKDDFRWHHSYYHGHMFQKTVAVRKILSNEDVLKLTKLFKEKNN